VHKSIKTTLQGADPSPEQVASLAAYLETLQTPPPLSVLNPPADAGVIARGKAVFEKHRCGVCHAPPDYTTPAVYDVGLPDKFGKREFNPPSLVGVGHRDHLFHDNRAASLEDVFAKHRHQLQGELSSQDLADLTAFLRSL
jgi:mono/diheme cytochrome c family protein